MKRVDFKSIVEVERTEKRSKAQNFDSNTGSYFVVVRNGGDDGKMVETGIFDSYEKIVSSCVFVRFYNKTTAFDWYERALNLPLLNDPNAFEIHTGGTFYDVTQDKDFYGVVAIYIGNTKFSICKAVPSSGPIANLDMISFLRGLTLSPLNIGQSIRLYTSSKQIAFGLNYGLYNWPKHIITAKGDGDLWTQIESNIEMRRTRYKQIIAVDYNRRKNVAYCMARDNCVKQNSKSIISFEKTLVFEQCVTWVLYAKRIGICRDIRIKIARLVWNQNIWEYGYHNKFIDLFLNHSPPSSNKPGSLMS